MKLINKILLIGSVFLILIFTGYSKFNSEKVDIVIFSYDRPMQVYALLESIQKYVKGYGQISMVYRVSNQDYNDAYEQVKKDFSSIIYLKQGQNPKDDFKDLTMHAAFESPNEYLAFCVDDVVVKDNLDLSYCATKLKQTNAHAFLVRLGKNIVQSYMGKYKSPVPKFETVENGLHSYIFRYSKGDWAYPNNVDFTIYSKQKIKGMLENIPKENFHNPYFEVYWYFQSNMNEKGLFFDESKIVNICINLVNELDPNYAQFTDSWKQNMYLYEPKILLEKFNSGYKFDISPIHKIRNPSPHIEFQLNFIKR
ncbi:hypothetical protein M1446_00860 [Candidatus Dependentiae bacterium]|nr:hypothetical protein [Candidatus Dependentiae bacterium]